MGSYAQQEDIVMNTSESCTVFEKIISPLLPLLKKEADAIKNDANLYKLSLFFFSINLLYGIVKRTKSIRLLITEIKTTSEPLNFDLVQASSSMYSEAFSRYDPALFKRIFYQIIILKHDLNSHHAFDKWINTHAHDKIF